MVDLSKYLSPSAAGRRAGVSADYVRTLTKSGRLPYVTTSLGRLIAEQDVDKLAAERRRRAEQRGAGGAAGAA